MNKTNLHDQLSDIMPEVPDAFRTAMRDTLAEIVAQEEAQPKRVRRPFGVRRAVVLALLAALLLGTAACAAMHWHLFDTISFMTGVNPLRADEVMQANLAEQTVNGVKITVREAGYDGRTLFVEYAYQFPDVTTPMGSYRNGVAESGLGEEDFKVLEEHGVGWWIDNIWFDGRMMDMTTNSGGDYSGSPNPGELIFTEYYRLDNGNVTLSGPVEVSMPIGERQSVRDYSMREHPERYDADGKLLLPDKGMITFTLDARDTLSKVVTEHPNVPYTNDEVTAKVAEFCRTPLLTYITLNMEPNAEALAAYIEKNGDGYYDEEGNLLWPYSGMDVYGDWLTSLELVDGEGKLLFPGHNGNNGYGDKWAEYMYPYIETVPDELWLAPILEDGAGDLTRAVRVH